MRFPCYLLLAFGLMAGFCLATGCQKEIPDNELGRVLEDVPDASQLPKMDEPYKLRYPSKKAEPPKPYRPWLPIWLNGGSIPPDIEVHDHSILPEDAW